MLLNLYMTLAQMAPWEDAQAPKQNPPQQRLSFQDLQQSLRQWHEGTADSNSNLRNGLLILAGVIVLSALIVNLRAKIKKRVTEESDERLAKELIKIIPFPMGSRMMLKWVARSTHISFPALLLSSQLFDNTISVWAEEPTFAIVRKWGYGRLMKLRDVIFDPE